MSAPSGRKKRFGSRRRIPEQNKTSDPDVVLLADSTSAARGHIPEENIESLGALSNADHSQQPPSPEHLENGRKLESSQQSEESQHVEDSVPEQYNKPTEEVEEYTFNETLKTTQMQTAIEPERQTELSQGKEEDTMSVSHSYSATTPAFSSEVQSTDHSGLDEEMFISVSEGGDVRTDECKLVSYSCDSEENMLEGSNKSDTLEGAEVSDQIKENVPPFGSSEFSSFTGNRQLIDQSKPTKMPDEELHVYSETDTEKVERHDDTDLFWQDGNLLEDYSESVTAEDAMFSNAAELTTENSSLRKDTETGNTVEQPTLSSIREELPTNEVQKENLYLTEVGGAQHPEEAVRKVKEFVKDSAEDAEESEPSSQIVQSETNVPFESQSEDNPVSPEEQTLTSFNPVHNRRKLGSSRRNKGRQNVKESAAETEEDAAGNTGDIDPHEATDLLTTETAVKEESEETGPKEMDKLESSQTEEVNDQDKEEELIGISEFTSSNIHPSSTADQQIINHEEHPSVYPVRDTETNERDEDTEFVGQDNNVGSQSLVTEVIESSTTPETTMETGTFTESTETEHNVETATISSPEEELYTKEEHVNLSEVGGAQHPEEDFTKVEDQDVTSSEIHQTDLLSASVIHDFTEDNLSGNLVVRAEESASNQDSNNQGETKEEPPIKDNNIEALDQRNEDDQASYSEEALMSHTETPDTAPCQVYEGEGQEVDDMEPTAERVVCRAEESEPSSQIVQSETNVPFESQSEDNPVSPEEQTLTSFNPVHNRRKLGSSRRNKGRQNVKESVAETEEDAAGNTGDIDPHEVTDLLFRDTETNERDEDTEFVGQDNNVGSQSLVKAEVIESSTTPETTMETGTLTESTETEHNVETATISSPEEELYTKEEHVNLSEVSGAQHPEEDFTKVEDQDVTSSEMHDPMNYSSVGESRSSVQTLQSEIQAPLDSRPQHSLVDVKEQTHTSFSSTGSGGIPGSSRRDEGRQHVTESVAELYKELEVEAVESIRDEKAFNQVLPSTETMWQQELKEQTDQGLKSTDEKRQMISTLNEEENMQKENDILPQNVMDNLTIAATRTTSNTDKDDFLNSKKEVCENEKKLVREPIISNQLSGCETAEMHLMQSPEVSAWKDDSHVRSISGTPGEEGDIQVQNMEVLSCETQSQTNDVIEVKEDVEEKDVAEIRDVCETEETGPLNVRVSDKDEVGQKCEESSEKEAAAQETNTSHEVSHAEEFAAAENKSYALAQLDIGHEENVSAEPAVDKAEHEGKSQHGSQDQTHSDYKENLQIQSKQKKRKMGSTRRSQINRRQEEGTGNLNETKERNVNAESDMSTLDKMGGVEEVPVTLTTEVLQNLNAEASPSIVHEEQETRCDLHDVMAVLSEHASPLGEKVVNPDTLPDMRGSDRNVDVVHLTSVDQSLPPNTESVINTESLQVTQGRFTSEHEAVKQTSETAGVADLEPVKFSILEEAGSGHEDAQANTPEPQNLSDGAHDKNLDRKNASPVLNLTNRRRKMGSTRRMLGTMSGGDDLHPEQEVNTETTEAATSVGDAATERIPGSEEKELKHQKEHKDSDSEPGKEDVPGSNTGDSHGKSPAQQTGEENPFSGQLVEADSQLIPHDSRGKSATSPRPDDGMSESASRGRKRKMGSHRKPQRTHENQTARDRVIDAEPERRLSTDERAIETHEEHGGRRLDKTSEVDRNDMKPSSDISASNTGEHSQPQRNKTRQQETPPQHLYVEVLGQGIHDNLSLAGGDLKAGYHVAMIGDSSVGKTSFMKRAQSGKFSLDIPASVGLDTCLWTVLVDGKPVVLQLWDTAGQERFHSITRQILHKSQAFLLMYDVTSSQSFSAVPYWAKCIQEAAVGNVVILLLGNKSDHAGRQVTTKDGEDLAKEYKFDFMECSAATGDNVVQSLETVARLLSQKVDRREEDLVLHKEPQQRKTSSCC